MNRLGSGHVLFNNRHTKPEDEYLTSDLNHKKYDIKAYSPPTGNIRPSRA
jgi:hypothetical protein